MRCKKDQVCIVINDDPNSLCNIGAIITVRVCIKNTQGDMSWTFDSASRLLKTVNESGLFWILDSREREGIVTVYPDNWLLPITPEDDVVGEVTDVLARIPHSEHA